MANKRIEHLRDKLLARGQPMPTAPRNVASSELSALSARIRPFAEVMYLVLAADEVLTERERDVLRGALRSLSDGALSSTAMDEMLEDFRRARARDGIELRLDFLASALCVDRTDARLALRLATAAADADHGVGPEEEAVIRALGERLGVSRSEMLELLDGAQRLAQ